MTKRAREFTEMRTLLTSHASLNMVLKIPGVKLCGMALAIMTLRIGRLIKQHDLNGCQWRMCLLSGGRAKRSSRLARAGGAVVACAPPGSSQCGKPVDRRSFRVHTVA